MTQPPSTSHSLIHPPSPSTPHTVTDHPPLSTPRTAQKRARCTSLEDINISKQKFEEKNPELTYLAIPTPLWQQTLHTLSQLLRMGDTPDLSLKNMISSHLSKILEVPNDFEVDPIVCATIKQLLEKNLDTDTTTLHSTINTQIQAHINNLELHTTLSKCTSDSIKTFQNKLDATIGSISDNLAAVNLTRILESRINHIFPDDFDLLQTFKETISTLCSTDPTLSASTHPHTTMDTLQPPPSLHSLTTNPSTSTHTLHSDTNTTRDILDQTSIHKYKELTTRCKNLLFDNLNALKHIDLTEKLDNASFQEFKLIRSKLTKWFTDTQYLLRHLQTDKPNKLINLSASYSQILHNRHFTADLNQQIRSIEDSANNKAINLLIDEQMNKSSSLQEELTGNLLLKGRLYAKAFRVVIRANKELLDTKQSHTKNKLSNRNLQQPGYVNNHTNFPPLTHPDPPPVPYTAPYTPLHKQPLLPTPLDHTPHYTTTHIQNVPHIPSDPHTHFNLPPATRHSYPPPEPHYPPYAPYRQQHYEQQYEPNYNHYYPPHQSIIHTPPLSYQDYWHPYNHTLQHSDTYTPYNQRQSYTHIQHPHLN
jgi:hypothetical protein